jgi:hypothetical protein
VRIVVIRLNHRSGTTTTQPLLIGQPFGTALARAKRYGTLALISYFAACELCGDRAAGVASFGCSLFHLFSFYKGTIMPKKQIDTETAATDMSLESLLESAITLAKAAANIATSLAEHLNAVTRVDHGEGSRGPTPTDHATRAKITATITALGDFRLAVRHSLLLGVHDEDEKAKIIVGDYC